jgi:dUTP pyrophosphatase
MENFKVLKNIRELLLKVVDPNDSYTEEEFNKEIESFNQANQSNRNFLYNVNFVNKSNNLSPEYATNGSSGFDLRANLSEPMVIAPNKVGIVPTGLFFDLNDNFEIQIRSRSGLAAKNQVIVLNSPGTIDSDYKGEIKIILFNLGEDDFVVNNGDRIAQGVIATVLSKNIINLQQIKEITKSTERNDGHFGSTGIK